MLQFLHHGGDFVVAVINPAVHHAHDSSGLPIREMVNVKFVVKHQNHPAPVGIARGILDSGHVNICPGKGCAVLELELQPFGGMGKQAEREK